MDTTTSKEEQVMIPDQEKVSPPAPTVPDKDILYSYLFAGKITMEEYLFLCKKKTEGSIG